MNDLIVVEKIAQWQKLKTLVLDSVSSPTAKRVYNIALDEVSSLVPTELKSSSAGSARNRLRRRCRRS